MALRGELARRWDKLRATDRLIALYVAFVTVAVVFRHPAWPTAGWLVGMHLLVILLLAIFTELPADARWGHALRTIYPFLLLPAFYGEIGLLSLQLGTSSTFARDAVVQRWEAALFGGQISYEWIRRAPSVFWSGLLHLAYFSYYPMLVVGPLYLLWRGQHAAARRVVFATMVAFFLCYAVFVLFPVAGPNYVFEHPSGPVREVWSARLVYGVLAGGSSFGAAFPSSHVAAAGVAIAALWREARRPAALLVIPALLLAVGTVYCQMHYGVDVIAGLAVIPAALGIATRVRPERV